MTKSVETSLQSPDTDVSSWEDIYLHEDRYNKPKEMFKHIDSLVATKKVDSSTQWLDVGCATGEFLFYLEKTHPIVSCTGIDISEPMIEKARQNIPNREFICGDIFDLPSSLNQQYDIVTCTGVLQIFDELEMPIKNLVEAVRPGGLLIITGIFNTHDVDVRMRHRRNGRHGIWESGWNLYSTNTFESYLDNIHHVAKYDWHDFRMPFKLVEGPDPMRTWTIQTEDDPHQLVNGAGQVLYVKSCRIQIAT